MKINSVEEYLKDVSDEQRKLLEKIRAAVRKAAPEAVETISYQMPTFKLHGKNLVHFAAWKEHIGFYPTPSGTREFSKKIAKYASAKGSIKFPFNEPIPYDLITEIVKFRVQEIEKGGR